MPRMLPAGTDESVEPNEIVVDFDANVQELAALEAAAYRLIGVASCSIDRVNDRFICSLVPNGTKSKLDPESLKLRFIQVVTDENVRHRMAERTQGTRNVILALAFGSLATEQR